MKIEYEKIIIGYSGLVLFGEYYEYNENACYVADSRETCNEFMMIADRYDKSEFRIEEKSFQDLLDDFGVSRHQYVMEELAYEKFKKITQKLGTKYTEEDYDGDIPLKVVKILVNFR